MTDKGPEIRRLARIGLVKYTRHAIERIKEYGLTVMQVNEVNEILKNCNHNQNLGDCNGYRVEGRAPAADTTGTRNISAHIHLSEKILVITVINN